MTEPASLPFFVGVDLAAPSGDQAAMVIARMLPDGRVRLLDGAVGHSAITKLRRKWKTP